MWLMAKGFRAKRDPLGALEVPADAYYGVQTARAVENFPDQRPSRARRSRRRHNPHQESRRGNQRRAGPSRARHRGARSARPPTRSSPAALRDQFVVDVYQAGAGTSHNMNANEVLANRAGEILGEPRARYTRVHPNDHVNMGQSTNDVYPTATRLALLLGAAPLVAAAGSRCREPGAQGGRVRARAEDRPHAPAGRRADHARPGVQRLRRVRPPRRRRSSRPHRRSCAS